MEKVNCGIIGLFVVVLLTCSNPALALEIRDVVIEQGTIVSSQSSTTEAFNLAGDGFLIPFLWSDCRTAIGPNIYEPGDAISDAVFCADSLQNDVIFIDGVRHAYPDVEISSSIRLTYPVPLLVPDFAAPETVVTLTTPFIAEGFLSGRRLFEPLFDFNVTGQGTMEIDLLSCCFGPGPTITPRWDAIPPVRYEFSPFPVSEPSTMLLIGSGLAVLGLIAWRKAS